MMAGAVFYRRGIIERLQNKGYVWLSKRIIQNNSKIYYCHDCGNNFRA